MYPPVLPPLYPVTPDDVARRASLQRAWLSFGIGAIVCAVAAGSLLDLMQIRSPWRFGRDGMTMIAAVLGGLPAGLIVRRALRALGVAAAAAIAGLWLGYLSERMTVRMIVSGSYREDTLGDLWYFLLFGLVFGAIGAIPGVGLRAWRRR